MTRKLIPRSMLSFPFSFWEGNEDEWMQDFSEQSGLSVSEDDNNVYVEAALPGIKPGEIELSFEKGVLWIKAEKKEEVQDKSRKYYRKSTGTFSYRVAVPGNVDESRQPEAVCKNGVLKVSFAKTKKTEAKKIPVKEE